jgi:hypothetical protein
LAIGYIEQFKVMSPYSIRQPPEVMIGAQHIIGGIGIDVSDSRHIIDFREVREVYLL